MNKEIVYHSEQELMKQFERMVMERQNKVLRRALEIAICGTVGTFEYAIIKAMGYKYEDDGSFSFIGRN